LAVCVTLASLQAAVAFAPVALVPIQRQGCRCENTVSLGLRMQSEPAIARRSLLGAAGAFLLLGGEQQVSAKGAAAAKPVYLETGLSYVQKKSADGPFANLAFAVNPGDFVVINYIAYLKDGTIFDNTIKRGKPLAFQTGKKQVVPGLERGIMGMKGGEERQLFLKSQWGYGEDGVCLENAETEEDEDDDGCLVPPDTDLVYDVTLLNVGPSPNN